MNQILMVEDKSKKTKNKTKTSSSGPIEIKNIVRFFAIVLIIFGISFIGQGSYAIYKESKGRNTKDMPVVSMHRENDTIIITANSINKIMKFKYSWDNAEETVIPIESNYMEEQITLLNQNNTIHLTIEDETGRAIKYIKQIEVEGIDMTKPTINIEKQNNGNVKISATDETEMAYITYQINDGEEIRIDKSEIEDKTLNYILTFDNRGENNLLVTAVDTSGNIETMEEKIVVSETPKVQMSQNKNILTLQINDDAGIKKVEINLNGQIYAQDNMNQKEIILNNIPLKEGTNIIKITITNVEDLVFSDVREMSYEP